MDYSLYHSFEPVGLRKMLLGSEHNLTYCTMSSRTSNGWMIERTIMVEGQGYHRLVCDVSFLIDNIMFWKPDKRASYAFPFTRHSWAWRLNFIWINFHPTLIYSHRLYCAEGCCEWQIAGMIQYQVGRNCKLQFAIESKFMPLWMIFYAISRDVFTLQSIKAYLGIY